MGRRASVGGAQKSVAIKFMSARVAADERHRRMFLAEARLSMLMTHSNVVQVFDAGEDAGRLYLVMEWIDGLNLAQLCELRRREGAGPWPPRLCGYVIGEVLRGLAYAHHLTHEGQSLCIVHRDISPHNVLVSTSGEVKLADFGVARLTTEETSGIHIKGKLRYMAPEHLAGRSREPTVDLYGVGAVLHELLAGTRFRDEADEVDLYGQILGGYVPPLPVPGVPPELASLREGLLQAEPRQRIPTAARALEYLAAWAGYRNASAELGALCRATMGVVAPRSGIESAPTRGAVDQHADTDSPSVPTHTAGPAALGTSGGPSAGTSGRTSGVEPAATRTSGAVPVAGLRVPPTGPMQVGARRPVRRRALLVGAGILAVGSSVGGVAVMAWLRRRSRDERRDGTDGTDGTLAQRTADGAEDGAGADAGPGHAAGSARDVAAPADAERREPAPTSDAGVEAGQGSAAAPEVGERGAASTDDDAGADAEPSGASTDATGGDEATGEPNDAKAPAGTATEARPRRPSGRATVELRLRSPLRLAYARLGERGPGFPVDPKAERTVTAGRTTVWWRESPDAAWRKGKSFTFEAGRRYTVRLTTDGPVLE